MTNTLTIALWASNLAAAVADLAAWVQIVEARMVEAKAAGAAILLLPEYASAQWLRFAPADLPEHREIPWLADYAEAALQALAPLPARHGVALLAGTIPAHCPAATPPLRNRAHLLLPDGRTSTQDKLSLTPDERDPAAWNLAPGTRLQIVEWQGLRLAVVICLDIELPALAARLAPFELDLVLVPSMTSGGGFWRVSSCCRARAVELFTVVAMVGCSGAPRPGNRPYVGGANVFIPCEESLGLTGVFAELAPQANAEGAGPLLIARAVPIGKIRELRRAGAEVWPGAWQADHVSIECPR